MKCARRQNQIGMFERVEVIPLLNEKATKANILAAMKRLAGEPGATNVKSDRFDGR